MVLAKNYIAVDLGAESGRVMLGAIEHGKLRLTECHRFGHGPVEQNAALHWDFAKMFAEIKTGIGQAVKQSETPIAGIGIDSWGVDYGLIGADGELIEDPYHYRDSRTDGMLEKAYQLMSARDIYENTGIQFMQLNTAYQLLAMRLADSPVLARADKLIMMADLVGYHLCGRAYGEYCLASTSQLLDMRTGNWAAEVFAKLELPLGIMPDIVHPGAVVGQLADDIAEELGCEPIPVIACGSHDTACAVAAVPAEGKDWAYISSGTWSLMGVEIPRAIINDKTFEYQFTNEGGVENTIRLLKNIAGLWLVQECRQQWRREGDEFSYAELAALAEKAEPFVARIDVEHSDFIAPGDMPAKINRHLQQTGQPPIEDKGQLVRVILECLAFRYRWTLEKLEDIIGQKIEISHIVGGGIQNELLCQFAANATGLKVVTGPVEATASGNIIMQAIAAGQIGSLEEGRGVIRNSYELKEYRPVDQEQWSEQYNSYEL